MKAVLSREQIREFDRLAIEVARIPSLVLMENAGIGAAMMLRERYGDRPGKVLVFAGTGNNGGDGYVLARHLLVAGFDVNVIAVGGTASLTPDARAMHDAFCGIGGSIVAVQDESQCPALAETMSSAAVLVDALFGTGLARPVTGLAAKIITMLNVSPCPCFALDLPSGIDADTGAELGIAVRADATCSFAFPKIGLFCAAATDFVGELAVRPIGVTGDLSVQSGVIAQRAEASDISTWLLPRPKSSHKGRSGRIAIIGGSPGKSGAALLAAQGALRAGAGLVTHLGLSDTVRSLEGRVREAMTAIIDPSDLERNLAQQLDPMDAIVVGPGLGCDDTARKITDYVVRHARQPVVVDADALTLTARDSTVLSAAAGERVLLPHAGEMARLLGVTSEIVESDRQAALGRLTSASRAVVVLKGPYSWVGQRKMPPVIVGQPCPALATGGSGDVLSGMVAALAVGLDPRLAAIAAVYLHSRAGAIWVDRFHSDRGLLASEIAELVPQAIAEVSRADVTLTD